MAGKLFFMLCAGLVGLLGLDGLYATYVDRRRIPRLVRALKRGSSDLDVLGQATYFPRPAEEAQLMPLVKPSDGHGGFFNLVTGEDGTGTLCPAFPSPLFLPN